MTDYTTVVIEADRLGRMSISCLDEQGYGHGYRLAGPKYCGCCTREPFIRAELTTEAVTRIREYLAIWDEMQTRQREGT